MSQAQIDGFDRTVKELHADVQNICARLCDVSQVTFKETLFCDGCSIAYDFQQGHISAVIVVGLGKHTVAVGFASYEAEAVLEAGDMLIFSGNMMHSINAHPAVC